MPSLPACPDCGIALKPLYSRGKKELVSYCHPVANGCPVSGTSIGARLLPMWSQTPGIHVEIVDGTPVFNDEGRGQHVDPEWLNQVVAYYTSLTATKGN